MPRCVLFYRTSALARMSPLVTAAKNGQKWGIRQVCNINIRIIQCLTFAQLQTSGSRNQCKCSRCKVGIYICQQMIFLSGEYGVTALHMACLHNHAELVHSFLTNAADTDIRDAFVFKIEMIQIL